eukprot:5503758-Heterocapsa_arctica.AAC.1
MSMQGVPPRALPPIREAPQWGRLHAGRRDPFLGTDRGRKEAGERRDVRQGSRGGGRRTGGPQAVPGNRGPLRAGVG